MAGRSVIANPTEGVAESLFNLASALKQQGVTSLLLDYAPGALHAAGLSRREILIAESWTAKARTRRARWPIAACCPKRRSTGRRLRIANNLDEQDRIDEAAVEFGRLAEERPGRADALIELGNLMRSHERFEEAVTAYDEALKRIGTPDRRHWTLLYYRGIALERSGNWPRAEADFLKALELEPDQPLCPQLPRPIPGSRRARHLDNALADAGASAVELAARRRLHRRQPGLGPTTASAATRRRSSSWSRRSSCEPQDPIINDHLGDAYWRVGPRTPRRASNGAARLRSSPMPTVAAKIEAKLQKG